MDTIDTTTGEIVERRAMPVTVEPPRAQTLIFASTECAEVFGALSEFQGACEPPKKTKTAKVRGQTKAGRDYDYEYAYAPLDEIHNVIREPMAKAGLAYRQFLSTRDGQWVMRTIIAHRSGQWTGCDYPLFWDQSRGMQGFASGATYARRYGLMLALGIVAEDDDDANVADGQQATVSGVNRSRAPQAAKASYQRQQAAPAPSEAKVDATKRWKELRDEIDAAMTVPDMESVVNSLAWQACYRLIDEAEGPTAAEGAMQTLGDRIERRREILLGQGAYNDR